MEKKRKIDLASQGLKRRIIMKVLVTGGAGFIGSHIVDTLVENGHDVVIIDNLSTGNIENVNDKAKFYNIDIRDKDIDDVFKEECPEYVIHHAAQIDVQRSIKDPVFDGDVNILGTINILENCKRCGAKKIIYASSAAVYGAPRYLPIDEKHDIQPISYYGISKFTPEHYIQVYGNLYDIKYTILRYANVYGIRQDPKGEGGVVSIFVDRMLSGKSVTIFGDGEQTRDFIYVDDIVSANMLALENGDGEIVNIGTGIQTSVNDLYGTMEAIIKTGKSPINGIARAGDIKDSYFNIEKAEKILGFKPKYSLKDGLGETIRYYRSKYELINEAALSKQINSNLF